MQNEQLYRNSSWKNRHACIAHGSQELERYCADTAMQISIEWIWIDHVITTTYQEKILLISQTKIIRERTSYVTEYASFIKPIQFVESLK